MSVEHEEFDCLLPKTRIFPLKTGDYRIDAVIAENAVELRPIVRMEFDRWSILVDFKSSHLELLVDLGRSSIWSSKSQKAGAIFETPLAEIQLRLKSGAPEDVFDFARLLVRQAPIRLSSKNTLEAMVVQSNTHFSRIQPRKRTETSGQELAADLLARSLNRITIQFIGLQSALVDMRRVEAVRQMRVALRRLRVLERVFRPHLKSRYLANIAVTAKLFAQQLGAARDWDVLITDIMPLALKNEFASRESGRLGEVVERRRAESWANAVATINDANFTVFLIDVMEAAILASWDVDIKQSPSMKIYEFAPCALDRSLKKTKAVVENTRLALPNDLHRLRLALKKHRYSVQMFQATYPKAQRKAYMKALSALQNLLGTVNDAEVGQRLVNDVASGNGDEAMRAAGFVCGYKAAQAEAAIVNIRTQLPVFMSMESFWRG